ncbi:hypothetical protein [Streptomyces sp. NPDC006784]|uniref:hypothetical protein n=1 Tax=Streptomyces sp. NPDC006784 TaxID=3364764 RepID=UPI0036CE6771
MTTDERRKRFRTAVYQAIERGDDPADAAKAVSDQAQHETVTRLRDERDRAIRIAVALENQLAAVQEYARHSDDTAPRTRETILRLTDGYQPDASAPQHLARGSNAEKCPACVSTRRSYVPLLLCPGPDDGAAS